MAVERKDVAKPQATSGQEPGQSPRFVASTRAFISVEDVIAILDALRYLPEWRCAADGLEQAAMAARNGSHSDVEACLRKGVFEPIAALLNGKLPPLVQRAVGQSIGGQLPNVLSEAIRKKLNDELLTRIIDQTLDKHLEEFKEVRLQIAKLSDQIGHLSEMQERAFRNSEDAIIPVLAQSGSLLSRYYQNGAEKAELGRYIARAFFQRPIRSFVMASSTSVHLGQQVRRNNVPGGCFFFTNSVAFPLAVLGDRPQHQVNVFWGQVYDHDCGGWLPNIADAETEQSLRSLFTPESWNLSTAFIVPRKIAVSNGMYFVRSETARMATILSESAQNIVVLATADRLVGRLEDTERSGAYPMNGDWTSFRKSISLVVAGSRSDHGIHPLASEFKDKGLDVHYQDPASNDWRVEHR